MNLATSTNRRLYNSRRNVPTSLPLVETRQQHKSQIWFDLLKCRGRPDFTTVVCCKNCWDLEWPWPGVSGQLTGTSSRVTLYKLSLCVSRFLFFPPLLIGISSSSGAAAATLRSCVQNQQERRREPNKDPLRYTMALSPRTILLGLFCFITLKEEEGKKKERKYSIKWI